MPKTKPWTHKTNPIRIRLTAADRRDLEQAARARQTTISEIARDAIQRFLRMGA